MPPEPVLDATLDDLEGASPDPSDGGNVNTETETTESSSESTSMSPGTEGPSPDPSLAQPPTSESAETPEGDLSQSPTSDQDSSPDDDPRFKRLVQASKELTEGKVRAQLSRMEQSFVIPHKQKWATPNKHLIVNMALGQCQDTGQIERYWPLIKKLRGPDIGNSALEIKHVISLILLEVLFKELDKV